MPEITLTLSVPNYQDFDQFEEEIKEAISEQGVTDNSCLTNATILDFGVTKQ
jgi:hypothetical protein